MKKHIFDNLSYTAGLFDGEGSVLLSYKQKDAKFRHPYVSLSSTTYDLLMFLKKHYGGHICKQKTYQTHHKKAWSWKLYGRSAITFLQLIYPHLKEHGKYHRAKLIATKYLQVTIRNGKYTKEQLRCKQAFEKEFFHPSKP